ncbi:plexin-b1 sep receptor [Lynx pardinus]|uniref:Plexin-b1 sep receptor n=1 Tax=Lynx pardinus TaxID=191816 RepID=A0A485M965_LYNPA|nr:plexin-b1 sep receptor [Lynx pardinus]
MPALGPALLQALWAGWVLTLQPPPPAAFTPNGTHLQHLARDPTSGTLYLGATNFLFQLSPELQLEATVPTGPVLDSRDCLPPVMPDECPQAQPTNNLNQLLLVSPGALVVCGSVHQGVCELRHLGQLERLLLRPERPGDTQYVAANDPAVSTVGLVAQGLTGEPLLFVGRGYTSRGVGGGIPPITTRTLWPLDPQTAFSYEETAKLAVGRLSEYSHHFVSAFARGASAYFLFLRRDLQAQSRAFRAYVSRVCLRDQHYYSYVELPLACQGSRYGLIQAAAVATSLEVTQGEVLFAAFSSAAPPTVGRPPSAAAGASGASALCAFPLDEVDRLANRTRDACYTREGRATDGVEVAYIEYDVNSDCAQLPVDTLDAYPCGSDHTPSPMASRVPLEATPVLEWPGIQLTAVAVTMEDGHTIAFLGDSQGHLHRVYLGPGSDGHPYSTQNIQQGSAVSRDLTFDGAFEHLYVMTQSTLLKVPVASCAQHLDCASCLAHKDPYCGWCVLLGRCNRHSECSRGQGPERWLWSFQPELGCLQVAAMSPANISREERREVFLSVPDLPPLWPGETYSCQFGDHQTPALLTSSGVMCPSPDPSEAPALPRGADHVSVSVELRFGAVVIAKASLSIYDCAAVSELRPSAQCQACVSSRWGCNWCVWQQLLVLYDCSVGHGDCSRCQTAMPQYGCVWCKGEHPRCVAQEACGETEAVATQCPAPLIYSVEPLTGPVDGGTRVTIRGSNLGQHVQDVQDTVRVAGVPCAVDAQEYEVSSSFVCITEASGEEVAGAVTVEVPGRGHGVSEHDFAYQDPKVHSVFPTRGPRAGGTRLTLHGSKLLTGRLEDIRVVVGDQPCHLLLEQQAEQLQCETSPPPTPATLPVAVWFGAAERRLQHSQFEYTSDPNVTSASPTKSFLSGGRKIWVRGQNLDVVQTPRIRVTVAPRAPQPGQGLGRRRRVIPETACSPGASCGGHRFEEPCHVNSSQLITCHTPALPGLPEDPWVRVEFILDNLVFDFATLNPTPFSYEADPTLQPLNPEDPTAPFRHKPGSVLSVEGENLDLAMSKEEVVAMIGDGPCVVKTLTRHHLYCEPPLEQPLPQHHALREAPDALPEFTVQMGNLRFSLGHVQYDGESPVAFPMAAQVGLGVGTSLLALGVIIIVLIYRRKSKQALRDYKKVQIQLENLESSVRDRCKKEFTDLMTEMTDLTSDLLGSGIPFLDYKFIHTLESQRTFSARDRAYVASLLTVALHGKLEYFTDILRTLLSDLVAQYVAKNPKLMLRRTETVVEKLLTNWMSICLYTFVRDSVGEPLYMLFRGIKHQVDKGPVDSVTGKAKYTLNDNRLLREDVEYRPLTLNALLAVGPGAGEAQGVPVKVLDCDTISQAKEKMLDQLYKGVPLAQRPDPRTLDVEWRSGVAGHLILSDEDVTSEVQGLWRRLNTLQHYKVPDGATVALVPCLTNTLTGPACPTHSLPLRFWINIIKNPQFVFDVQTSDNMDAVLLVIAQTFMDACTLADHKLGRDSPINKLLYARDIPRYKRMVERYYADIRQTVPASDQEMNSILAELSRNYSGDLGARVALHELYKYINKYYDQIITALEEDGTAQKMQLGYRLQQIAAAVENKVTDL